MSARAVKVGGGQAGDRASRESQGEQRPSGGEASM